MSLPPTDDSTHLLVNCSSLFLPLEWHRGWLWPMLCNCYFQSLEALNVFKGSAELAKCMQVSKQWHNEIVDILTSQLPKRLELYKPNLMNLCQGIGESEFHSFFRFLRKFHTMNFSSQERTVTTCSIHKETLHTTRKRKRHICISIRAHPMRVPLPFGSLSKHETQDYVVLIIATYVGGVMQGEQMTMASNLDAYCEPLQHQ